MENNKYDLSIVSVCMNNIKNIIQCYDSIIKFTKEVSYELVLVAYFFSDENLKLIKNRYPQVKVIVSNEIRGFSENNNLALNEVNSNYVLILNDDTYIDSPSIDNLFKTFVSLPPEVAVLSPLIKYPNGKIQFNGRRDFTIKQFILYKFRFIKYIENNYHNLQKDGVFKSYSVSGACFCVKTKAFKNLGGFNDYYFFCPEDVDLARRLIELGYKLYVDSNQIVYHIAGGSSANKPIMAAIRPVETIGTVHYLGNNNFLIKVLLQTFVFIHTLFLLIINLLFDNKVKIKANLWILRYIYVPIAPKELFLLLFNKIKNV